MRYLKGVVTLSLDQDTCIGCGVCTEVCPHGVFRVADRKAQMVDRDACIECGACARNCPVDAITVQAGVGCATGIMQTALGMKSECCIDKQGCGCSPMNADKEDRRPHDCLGVSGAAPAPAGHTEEPQTQPRRNEDMSSTNDDRKPTDNMELPREQASACEPGCCCHAAGASGRTRGVLGAIILLAAAALAARAVMKSNTAASTPPTTAAFAAPQSAGDASAPCAAPLASAQKDATTTPKLAAQAAPETAPSLSAAKDVPATAVSAVAPTAPATASIPATPADGAPKASESDTVVGKAISGFADLNKLAADTTAVFVFLPGKTPDAGKAPTAQMQGAARTIEAQGKKVGLFTLKTGSRDYDQIAAQVSVPGVLALVKGRGMKAVEGEITETKLIQGFVAASSAGGCGPASGGCGPSGCK